MIRNITIVCYEKNTNDESTIVNKHFKPWLTIEYHSSIKEKKDGFFYTIH